MDKPFQQPNKPEDKKKDPFTDFFSSIEEFSEAFSTIDEVEITNNPVSIKSGKKGEAFFCVGSDGMFYVFLRLPDGKIKLIGSAQSPDKARTVGILEFATES